VTRETIRNDNLVGEIATPPDGASVAGDDKVVGKIATPTDRAPVAGDDSLIEDRHATPLLLRN
jgi:hypothetical protein